MTDKDKPKFSLEECTKISAEIRNAEFNIAWELANLHEEGMERQVMSIELFNDQFMHKVIA